MSPYEFLASLWRTVVPIIVTVLAAWLAHAGIHINSVAVSMWLGSAFGSVYYAALRWAETRLSARWGWLLGLASPPRYVRAEVTSVTPAAVEDGS
ncbi:hypothetical protein [Actinacidiphila sp. ITFR-21]|uniref:hypothetical protein n=1 Tax=Actinacidiphila sp. ITFR-21 TaxID=3075199 RepID=UPI0028898583|nr:hypothetical protein [Streptomyces sp. ITFR-21]WNI20295.1 hypothetical protein RLT57_33040 [Streptomyces sp. ITFR-21]